MKLYNTILEEPVACQFVDGLTTRRADFWETGVPNTEIYPTDYLNILPSAAHTIGIAGAQLVI